MEYGTQNNVWVIQEDGQNRECTAHSLLSSCDVQQFTKVTNQRWVQTMSHQELTRYKPQGKKVKHSSLTFLIKTVRVVSLYLIQR